MSALGGGVLRKFARRVMRGEGTGATVARR